MKRVGIVALTLLVLFSMLLTTACSLGDIQGVINGDVSKPLDVPNNLRVEGTVLKWNAVEYASGYTVLVNNTTTYTCTENSYSLQGLPSGEYTLAVKANGDGVMYKTSEYSDAITYTRNTDTGNQYEDEIKGAFGSFDEINTKNSFLGYGIDIINASAVTSKNVMVTYPIFDMDKLMQETLLKSNEHYNSFESIEGVTIESFVESMSNSTSITSGSHVSAKGVIDGVKLGASVSMSGGLSTSFTKTSAATESQYFIEIIAENQSYWLILQTSESRYKDILSEEFKRDLYDKSITPAQLFSKYGTHLLTSVAMGGNICMYYTMFTYDKTVTEADFAKVSSALKSNVEASYGRLASAGSDKELTFENAYTYEEIASTLGIYIDKKIVSAGGGSYGINNERTLFDNYFDWQKSLDTYPVVIGIKDSNSLYPIWELLDLDVAGASERYTELYAYFAEYGSASYDKLCETYSITPTVSPSDVSNIQVGDIKNYEEGSIVQVKAGDILSITFDVLPENANKYTKTFAVNDTSLATIDSSGILSISPSAKGGNYITVTITAGTVSKQITLYVVNTFSVTFNTRVNGITVSPIVGILEGYSIDEPVIEREGYILEGWYTDSSNTKRFDFENDSVNSHLTLYAKWVAIKPVVNFETNGGSAVDAITVAYKGTVAVPKNPTRNGYIFGGWYSDEELTETFDFETPLISNITIYAKWEKIEYTISFVTNGGTPVSDVTTSVTEEYKISEPKTTKTYFVIDGWYLDELLTERFDFETVVTDNIILYAKWNALSAYIQPVDSDGSSSLYDEGAMLIGMYSTDATQGFKVALPTPYKEGYTFDGWYINGEKIDLETYDNFKPRDDVYKVVARWALNSHTVTYLVDGEVYDVETYSFGSEIHPIVVEKTGYTFSGWKYDNKEVPSVMPDCDIVFSGTLTPNQYMLRYYVDGVLYSEKAYIYGSKIDHVDEPVESGKEFSGWRYAKGEIPEYMPAEDVRIDGTFDQVEFNITYYIDGSPVKTYKVHVGFEIPKYSAEKVGHTFSGWLVRDGDVQSLLPEVMPARDLSVYGTFSINTYIITVDTDGGNSIAPISQEYGTAVSKPENPTRTGYTFVGWSREFPSVMPDENITIKAIWAINSYTISFNTDGGSKIADITLNYGEPISKPNDPTKVGSEFVSWNPTIPATMPAENITVTANWQINSYTIVYNANKPSCACALSGSMSNSLLEYNAQDALRENNFSIVGHSFIGWSLTPDGSVVYKDKQVVMNLSSENGAIINLYAKWSLNTYTITYTVNGGKSISNTSYTTHTASTLALPNAVYKTYADYNHFLGWYTDNSLETKFVNDLRTNPRNITLYAAWDLCTVYNSIDSTPQTPTSGRVIIDWSGETDTNLKNHLARPDASGDLGGDIHISGKVNGVGTSEIIFIGDPSKIYTNFDIVIIWYAAGQEVDIKFVNFKYVTDRSTALRVYEDSGSAISIDVKGECSIESVCNSGHIIYLPDNDLTITGSGTMTITAGAGKSGSGNGESGGDAVVAKNVTINMKGTLNANGGNGGYAYDRSAGENGGNCSNGLDGYIGGNGGDGFYVDSLTMLAGNCIVTGGRGGDGGNASEGNDCIWHTHYGGNGGNAGSGGDAINASALTVKGGSLTATGGRGGDGGTRGGMHEEGDENAGYQGAGGAGGDAVVSSCVQNISSSATVESMDGSNGDYGSGTNYC